MGTQLVSIGIPSTGSVGQNGKARALSYGIYDTVVLVDGNLITSRFPYDLPQFMAAVKNGLVR